MKKINQKEMREIFVGIKNNEEASFNKLYEKYHRIVYGISFSILKNKENSEDVMQNVFSKIYELDKAKLPDKNEASWIYTVTKNEAISTLRKKNAEIGLDEIYEFESKDDEINNIIEKEEYKKIISGLSDKEKEIVSLKILSDLSFKEISKLVEEPTNTVKWRYYKAIHTLKLFLGSLSLSIVAFTIGISKIISIKGQKNEQNQMTKDTEEVKTENILDEELKNDKIEDETKKNQDINREEISNTMHESISQNNEDTSINQEIEEEISCTDIGIIGISSIFLVVAIGFLISFIKHQLNLKKKSSK